MKDTELKNLTESGLIGVAVDPRYDRFEQALEVARLADEHGADFVSAPDHPYIPRELENWTLLSTLAARTENIAVLSNVASLALRPPAMLAKAAASLQVLTGGRAVLGLGAGGPLDQIAGFGAPRLTTGESVSALEEALRVIPHLWDPDARAPLTYEGKFYSLEQVRFGPVPSRPVPIWVGAFGPRMLALTGTLADGWIPTNYYLDLADVPGMQRRVDDAARRAGRDPARIRRVFNVIGSIQDTGPTQNGRTLVGPPKFWAEALRDYRDRLAFDSFVFWPNSGDRLAQARRFLIEVRPHLGPAFN